MCIHDLHQQHIYSYASNASANEWCSCAQKRRNITVSASQRANSEQFSACGISEANIWHIYTTCMCSQVAAVGRSLAKAKNPYVYTVCVEIIGVWPRKIEATKRKETTSSSFKYSKPCVCVLGAASMHSETHHAATQHMPLARNLFMALRALMILVCNDSIRSGATKMLLDPNFFESLCVECMRQLLYRCNASMNVI